MISNQNIKWISASDKDLQKINDLADRVHTGLPERAEVFEEKFHLFPEGCCSLFNGEDLVGYGISHPWILGKIPPLDEFLIEIPKNADCLFVHDVVIDINFRGCGAAGEYLKIIVNIARYRGLKSLSLVSVYNTVEVWKKHGFQEATYPNLESKLKCYGDTARFMIMKLHT